MRILKHILLLVLICSLLLCGCGFGKSRMGVTSYGQLEKINNNESITVVGSSIEDGRITVVLDVHFDQITFNDFHSIVIQKSEVGANNIKCNIDETITLNQKDFFAITYIGEVTLVFTDESILDEHDLWTYVMYMEYNNGEGLMSTHRLCIGN